jgi:hypothetical protein
MNLRCPSLLRPGGGRTPPSTSPVPIPQLVPPASYGNLRRPTPSPPSQSPYLGPQFGNSSPVAPNQNPYLGVATSLPPPGLAQNPHMIAQTPHSYAGPSPALWRQDSYTVPRCLIPPFKVQEGFLFQYLLAPTFKILLVACTLLRLRLDMVEVRDLRTSGQARIPYFEQGIRLLYPYHPVQVPIRTLWRLRPPLKYHPPLSTNAAIKGVYALCRSDTV